MARVCICSVDSLSRLLKKQRAGLDLGFKTFCVYRLKPRARRFQVLLSAKYVQRIS